MSVLIEKYFKYNWILYDSHIDSKKNKKTFFLRKHIPVFPIHKGLLGSFLKSKDYYSNTLLYNKKKRSFDTLKK